VMNVVGAWNNVLGHSRLMQMKDRGEHLCCGEGSIMFCLRTSPGMGCVQRMPGYYGAVEMLRKGIHHSKE